MDDGFKDDDFDGYSDDEAELIEFTKPVLIIKCCVVNGCLGFQAIIDYPYSPMETDIFGEEDFTSMRNWAFDLSGIFLTDDQEELFRKMNLGEVWTPSIETNTGKEGES